MKKFITIAFSLLALAACSTESDPVMPDPLPEQNSTGAILVPFEQNDLFGYKSATGSVVIPARFQVAQNFTAKGLAAVVENDEWTYIDREGNFVIKPYEFDNGPDYFVEGVARFQSGSMMGFFDEMGDVVIPPTYDFAFPFCDGEAVVCIGCKEEAILDDNEQETEHYTMEGGRWGSISKTGAIVVPIAREKDEATDAPSLAGNSCIRFR